MKLNEAYSEIRITLHTALANSNSAEKNMLILLTFESLQDEM